MANSLDVVAIRVAHKRAIIIGMVMWAQSRLAIVTAASCYGSRVKSIDDSAAFDAKGDVERRLVRRRH